MADNLPCEGPEDEFKWGAHGLYPQATFAIQFDKGSFLCFHGRRTQSHPGLLVSTLRGDGCAIEKGYSGFESPVNSDSKAAMGFAKRHVNSQALKWSARVFRSLSLCPPLLRRRTWNCLSSSGGLIFALRELILVFRPSLTIWMHASSIQTQTPTRTLSRQC